MILIDLAIDGVDAHRFVPFAVDGQEAVSKLYYFDVSCDCTSGKLLDDAVLGAAATLRIGQEDGVAREVKGIVESFDVRSPTVQGQPAIYKFRIVPAAARLQYTRQSQIYATREPLNADGVLRGILSGSLQSETRLHASQMANPPFAISLKSSYPSLDHVVQYEETNLAFLSRFAEYYGIFFYFAQEERQDKIVLIDDNILAPMLRGEHVLSWKEWTAGVEEAFPDTIQRFDAHFESLPNKLYLNDYNHRLPHVPLLVDSVIDGRGTGNWSEHGDHYLTPEDGQFLAHVRAQAVKCRKSRFEGRSQVPRLSAGHVFTLRDHPFDSWNKPYLVLSVRHRARRPRPGLEGTDTVEMGYWNDFSAIPADIPFRPARETPCPKIDGLFNGRVEGDGSSQHPHMDDQGRYKIRLCFDLGQAVEGKGSRWVRMSLPFGGDGDGMHFPLYPGTEVIVGFVNGDPDRPVILGAVPNPRNKNVVTNESPLVNRILYRAGMGLEAFGGAPVQASAPSSTQNSSGSSALSAQNAFSASANFAPSANLASWPASAPLMQENALDSLDNHSAESANSLRLWASGSSPSAKDSYGHPQQGMQWLRLGQAGSFSASGNSLAEGYCAVSGFDLATSGSGRIWATQGLHLMTRGGPKEAKNEPNRLITIDDDKVIIAHDKAITIGDAQGGKGYPSGITINASSLTINQDSIQSNVGQAGTIAITEGDTNAMVLGANNGLTFGEYSYLYGGLYTAVYLVGTINVNIGLLFTANLAFTVAIGLSGKLDMETANTYNLVAGNMVKVQSAEELIGAAKTEILSGMNTKLVDMEASITEILLEEVETKIEQAEMSVTIESTQINMLSIMLVL